MTGPATRRLIELAESLTPSGEIGDGTVAQFRELAARARIEQAAAIASARTGIRIDPRRLEFESECG